MHKPTCPFSAHPLTGKTPPYNHKHLIKLLIKKKGAFNGRHIRTHKIVSTHIS